MASETSINSELKSMTAFDSLEGNNKKPEVIRGDIIKDCPIKCVTVYNDRAETTRIFTKTFTLAGVYEIVLDGLSTSVDENSIHVAGGKGNATILEVSYHTRYEKKTLDFSKRDLLDKQFQEVNDKIDQHQRELDLIDKQQKWLDGRAVALQNINNERKPGSSPVTMDNPFSAENLHSIEQFLEFQYKMLKTIFEKKVKEQKEMEELVKKRESLEKEKLSFGVENNNEEHREVTISLHVAGKCEITLEVSYIISNCSWKASYDVRVNSDSASGKTQLTYYGIIINRSNEDWKDTLLSLSTASPSLSSNPPTLPTLKVDYKVPTPVPYFYQSSGGYAQERFKTTSAKYAMMPSLALGSSRMSKNYDSCEMQSAEDEPSLNVLVTKVESGLSSSTFSIPRAATIEADGKPHKVTIAILELESKFTYTAIPKLSSYVYLKAETLNTSDKLLLSGPISVFMDQNFVAHSLIESVNPQEKFDLFLGTDSGVKMEYKPVRKMKEKQGYISKVNQELIRHATVIKNKKPFKVTVFVYDQLPLSSDEKIKVKLLAPEAKPKTQDSNNTPNKSPPGFSASINDSNNVEWIATVGPGEEITLPFEYLVEWPQDKQVEFK